MTGAYVTLTKEPPLGLITLNRPPANSYEIKFMQDLGTAIEGVAADDDLKAALLVSASEKFFSGGGDIKVYRANSPQTNMEMISLGHEVLDKIARIPKVFIAVINGHAMGGGLEMALACDLRFAGDGKFWLALPESKLGLLPGNGGTQRLPRLIGASRALELILSGRNVSPQEALELGIVDKLFPAESVLDEAKAYALKLAHGPTKALAYIKRAVYEGVDQPLAAGLALEQELLAELFVTKDAQEGLTAFVEKREPEFKGK